MSDTMKILIMTILAGTLLFLAGCGGDSSTTTNIAGTASKGILYPGSVSIFAVDAAGVKATKALNTVATNSNGQFNADIGAYSGAIAIEATGTYIDEATGTSVTIDTTRPMRAAIDAVSPTTTKRLAVTPLTDLAYSLAGTLTARNIAAANARVSGLFKISDITAVEPVQPTTAAMGAASVSQQSYTLALAALSQMAKSSNPSTVATFSQIDTILNSFKTDLAASANAGLGTTNVNAFTSALGVITSSTFSGFDSAAAALGSVGTASLKLTLTTSDIPNGTMIGGIQGTITFPADTNMRLAPTGNGMVLSGLFNLTGNAVTSLSTNSFVAPAFTFAIINARGFAGGDFASLDVDISSGSPTAASFTPSNLSVIDINGTTLNVAVSLK